LKTRLITRVGTKIRVQRYWGEGCQGYSGNHQAESEFSYPTMTDDKEVRAKMDEHFRDSANWPAHCKFCGAPVPEDAKTCAGTKSIYDSGSDKPEPGDMFYAQMHEPEEFCYAGWENCDGKHLHVVLPNGRNWDIDSRASNCTMPQDKTHRCWVRHGEPSNVHVDKNGHTCQAGAGSILSGDYHGFLHNGELVSC
jgi:hypothetical protein